MSEKKCILKVPTDKVSVIKCDCGNEIFIVHGKIQDFEEELKKEQEE